MSPARDFRFGAGAGAAGPGCPKPAPPTTGWVYGVRRGGLLLDVARRRGRGVPGGGRRGGGVPGRGRRGRRVPGRGRRAESRWRRGRRRVGGRGMGGRGRGGPWPGGGVPGEAGGAAGGSASPARWTVPRAPRPPGAGPEAAASWTRRVQGAAARVVMSRRRRRAATPRAAAALVRSLALWHRVNTSATEGRSSGALARQRVTRSRNCSGGPSSWGSSWTIRYSTPCDVPSPKAGLAVAATWPSAKMSVAAVTVLPAACSGAMKDGVPMVTPLLVSEVASAARAIPKSMTRGPSDASSTLPGLRSRWTMPALWMTWRASAIPATSSRTVSTGSGPCLWTASASEGPGT